MRGKRLTREQALLIRAEEGPQKAIAHRYGISQGHVCRIKAGKVRAFKYYVNKARYLNARLIVSACTGAA